MGIAYAALLALYIFICFFLILVVLVQQGKGADIAGAFGGGGTQTAFGARGANTLLHKLTTGSFIGFILIAMTLT
ncbi:MAG TPA: preprotein translocase subunit SecG, partial [Thermoanaerobaculia bacterium]|nr:preprotein translocase subunit SecG [Thermoanaerobaculia bacterium]